MIVELRRYCPPLAAILLVLVTMQTFDLPGCADEVRHAAAHAAGSAHSDSDDRDEGPANPHGTGGTSLPDCLCHVVFIPGPSVPALGAPALAHLVDPESPAGLSTVFMAPPEHVPIA